MEQSTNMPIYLFPKTGIQHFSIKKRLSCDDDILNKVFTLKVDRRGDLPFVYVAKSDEAFAQGGEMPGGIFNEGSSDGDDYGDDYGVNEEQFATNDEDESSSLTLKDVIDDFSGAWIPFPYSTHNPFWMRVYLKEGLDGNYSFHFAVDTNFSKSNSEEWCLCSTELKRRMRPFARSERFWQSSYVNSILRGVATRRSKRSGDSFERCFVDAFCAYRVFVSSLEGFLPDVSFLGASGNVVDTDLIIDLGNTRTCMVVMERDSGQGEAMFHPVPVISRLDPEDVDNGTVDSRFVFSRGPLTVDGTRFPNAPVFSELSIARVGSEANDISAGVYGGDSAGGFSASYMSSPKRYLWDHSLQNFNWSFIDESADGVPVAIEGDILRYFSTGVGDPFDFPNLSAPGMSNPPETRYCRKSGLVFLAVELLTHAYSFINAKNHRENSRVVGSLQRRRVLRNVILTYPSGMSGIEQSALQKGVQKAVRLWHRHMESPALYRKEVKFVVNSLEARGLLQPEPEVVMECDEAIAIQMAYIYVQLLGIWHNDAETFFRLHGKKRSGKESIRVASIDIGGGTTDLAVVDFGKDPYAIGFSSLDVKTMYSMGITKGGDDLQREMLQDLVMPQVIRTSGVPQAVWNRNFSRVDSGSKEWETVKQVLVSQVWVPLMRKIWGILESGESVNHKVSTLFETMPSKMLTKNLSERIGWDSDIRDVELHILPHDMNMIFERVFGKILNVCADVIAQFECDVVVLGGRISSHEWIRNRLIDLAPVAPHCVIPLHHHPVDPERYPFADEHDRIADAKTCVVVGAAIHHYAKTVGGEFVVRTMENDATARSSVIGVLNKESSLMVGEPLFKGKTFGTTPELAFGGELWFGEKRLLDKVAPCNPLWLLRWSPELERMLQGGWNQPRNVRVTIARDNQSVPDMLRVVKVTGDMVKPGGGPARSMRPEYVRMSFQSIFDQTYWLDTGVIKMN